MLKPSCIHSLCPLFTLVFVLGCGSSPNKRDEKPTLSSVCPKQAAPKDIAMHSEKGDAPVETIAPPPKLVLRPAAYSTIPGWDLDQVNDALPALRKSCKRMMRKKDNTPIGRTKTGGLTKQWRRVCAKLKTLSKTTPAQARDFFQENFKAFLAMNHQEPEGRFTGYYEASMQGARKRHGKYQYPLYKRPADLVMVNMRNFVNSPKRRRIAGRVVGGLLKPYESRKKIRQGALRGKKLELVWIDDPVDGFFTQIQGSGLVQLDDGSAIRIGYAGQNGHPYTAIGRELARDGHITKTEMSMQSIRAWLANNPDNADEMMDRNHAYVFFTETHGSGPVGSQNVELTAERSAAVDREFIPQGAPLFIDTQILDEDGISLRSFQQLLIAQDSGGAIRGPVRADIFWGSGKRATAIAGTLKSRGRYFLLLPNEVAATLSTDSLDSSQRVAP